MVVSRPDMKDLNVLLSRRVAAVAIGTVIAAPLTACDTDQIGAAAVVGGERITVNQLQDEVRAVAAVAGEEPTGDQAAVQTTVLQRLIAYRLRDVVAEDAGVTISEADVDTFIADELISQTPDGDLTSLMVQNTFTEDTLREAVREVLLVEAIGGEQAYVESLAAAAEDVGIEVNPRFGTWTGVGLDDVSGSISVPVDDGGEGDVTDQDEDTAPSQ